MSSKLSNPIIIIGAGVGGLSAAIHLAAAGKQVLVLEQNSLVGGKMYQYQADGYYWDTGPSIITMRHVFEDLFATAGRNMADYLTLLPVDPATRYIFSDGTRLDTTRDLSKLLAQIAAIDEQDVEGYLNFLAYAARVHRITGPIFIYHQPPTWRTFLQVSPRGYLHAGVHKTLDQVIRQYVRSPQVRQLLRRYATYAGSSPYESPATLSVISHVELTGGVWYPQGGIHRVAAGMAQLATELGVKIQTDAKVREIYVEGDKVVGVSLGDGQELPAQAVVANVDVATVYNDLLPPSVATKKRIRQVTRPQRSCSGYVMLLGIEGETPELIQHNIFFCQDYGQEFKDIFQRGIPPEEPTVYVSITSKADADHAPPGCENWFVLVNAPPVGQGYDWTHDPRAYREVVLRTLDDFGVHIRDRIRHEKIMTPLDIGTLSGAWQGALYGISSNQAPNALRRPHNRCPHVKGLYFSGGTTHPGGGVPMVTLSGKVAAELLIEDLS